MIQCAFHSVNTSFSAAFTVQKFDVKTSRMVNEVGEFRTEEPRRHMLREGVYTQRQGS